MKTKLYLIGLAGLFVLVVSPALAQYGGYGNQRNNGLYPNQPNLQSPPASDYDRYNPRSDGESYGRPMYPKEPTFGDPRPYRHTNPNTCTGLLCD
jgi:hypothetical protein